MTPSVMGLNTMELSDEEDFCVFFSAMIQSRYLFKKRIGRTRVRYLTKRLL